MTARVFSWDYRQQPDMAAIAAAVTGMSGGRVFMREVETGTDSYAWAVSDAALTGEQAYRLYLGDDEEPEPEPDWRFEWELVAREGDEGVLKHKSTGGRYRIIPEEDL